ncbi:MAG: DUF2169 domain-containing protein [Pseudomonadota bacterium]
MIPITKPLRLGIMMRVERHRGRYVMMITTMGLADLSDGSDFLVDQGIWPMAVDQMPPTGVVDLGMPKPQGEFLIAGHAMQPGARPTGSATVSVQIGNKVKDLQVFGDRYWVNSRHGPVMTDPEPFETFKIDPACAFGGPDFALNTSGKGHGAEAALKVVPKVPLPNIEDPRRLIRSVSDTPAPVFAGSVDLMHPSRTQYRGTYSMEWAKKHHPELPDDFDPRYFLAAPHDQWWDGYFRGDEPIRIRGMSADHPDFTGKLPGLKGRTFIKPKQGRLVEVPTVLDTVWIFGTVQKAVVFFRSKYDVADIEATDLERVMIGYGPIDGDLRGLDYFEDVFEKRTSPDTAHKYALADYMLGVELSDAEKEAQRLHREKTLAARADAFHEGQQWFLEQQFREQGLPLELVPTIERLDTPMVYVPTEEELASGRADVARAIDEAETLRDEILDELDVFLEDVKKLENPVAAAKALDNTTPQSPDVSLSTDSKLGLPKVDDILSELRLAEGFEQALAPSAPDQVPGSVVGPAQARIEEARAGMEAGIAIIAGDDDAAFEKARARVLGLPEGGLLADASAGIDQMPDLSEELSRIEAGPATRDTPKLTIEDDIARLPEDRDTADVLAQIEQANAQIAQIFPNLPHDPDLSALEQLFKTGAGDMEPVSVPESAELKATAKQQIDSAAEEMVDKLLEIRRFSPKAIAPIEPISPAVARRLGDFIRAEIDAGRSFASADLAGCDLEGANLSGLDLTGVQLEKANLKDVNLSNAILTDAVLTDAVADGANFAHARMERANLSGLRARKARFDHVTFGPGQWLDLDLEHASFCGTSWADLTLVTPNLARARFDGSSFERVSVIQPKADHASFREIRSKQLALLEGTAEAADFDTVEMTDSAFVKMAMPRANFANATFNTAGFHGETDLTEARFDHCTGVKAGWNMVTLRNASFIKVRLHECLFNTVDMTGVDMRLADLKMSIIKSADVEDADLFGVNLIDGRVLTSRFKRSNLRGASLYRTSLFESDFAGCDMTDANLAHTPLEMETDVA